jgi:hypothetical protein
MNSQTGQLEPLDGLTRRRLEEANLVRGGEPAMRSALLQNAVESATPRTGIGGASAPTQQPTEKPGFFDSLFSGETNLPLVAAGLGILGGDSPFAGVNIGKGGLAGVQMIMQQRKAKEGAKKLAEAAALAQQRLGIQQEQHAATLAERKRHNLEIEKRSTGAAAPSGYRSTAEGNLEFIPGGPADPALKVKDVQFTEGASKAANFANMMTEAEKTIEGMGKKEPDGTQLPAENPVGFWGALREGMTPESVANVMRSPEYQKYRQAAMQWVRAKLRKESGAAISNQEFEGEFNTFFPQYGDSPEAIAQKRAAREEAQRGMIAESRGAYEQLFQGVPAKASPVAVQGTPQDAGPKKPASKAEYDALPSGTQFIDPEGNIRIKP